MYKIRASVRCVKRMSLCVLVCSPDQSSDPLCGYVEQLAVQNPLRVCTVSYECDHEQANVSFVAVLYSSVLSTASAKRRKLFHCVDDDD